MNERSTTRRRRRPASDLDAERRTRAIADNLGRDIRETRRRLHITQAALAGRVGIHQTWVSDIELGRGDGVPLAIWVALGVALDRPLAVSLSRDTQPDRLADAGHLEIQELLASLANATGRSVMIERPSRSDVSAHSTDVAIRDDRQRALILAEAWNTISDLGAAIRSTHQKVAEATVDLPQGPWRVATVWVVRASRANRELVARYPHVLAAAFGGSSHGWAQALVHGAPPPVDPGLVWFDPASKRLTAWRRPPLTGTMDR